MSIAGVFAILAICLGMPGGVLLLFWGIDRLDRHN